MDYNTFGAARSYVDDSIAGTVGVLAGKNCTIASTTKTGNITTVVFNWTADDGTSKTTSIQVADGVKGDQGEIGLSGADGASIIDVTINELDHLICTLSNGTEVDAGLIAGGSTSTKVEASEINGNIKINEVETVVYDSTNVETHMSNIDNPHSVTATQIGLGNVDNTSDLDKPVSTATQSALDTKASTTTLTAHTGNADIHVTAADKTKLDSIETGAKVNVQSDWNETDNTSDAFIKNKPTSLPASDVSTWAKEPIKPTYSKSEIGLSDVPNVATNDQTPTYSEASTLATLTSGEKMSIAFGKIKKAITSLISHTDNISNPHSVTKSQVGLGNVDNTSDANKPVSTATQTALDTKASTTTLTTHTDNNNIHVTAADKTAWNGALISKADTITVNNALALKANISDINTVTKDQGTKATYTEITAIPNATAGDVWYCTETGHYYRYTVGSTWADVGTGFDALNALENASGINYDNTETEISSTNIQGAVDEVSKGLVDVVLGGTVNIKKSLTWNNGWINTSGVVIASTKSQYSTPFLLKKGEVVSVTTNNTNICCIGTTTASTVTVGNTITTIKKTSSVAGSETYSYKAVEDINIVVCVLKSDYSVLFSLEDIYSRVDEQRDSRIVKNLLTKSRHGNCVTLLHFSDIHGDSKALTRIMDDYNNYYYGSVNGVICTGDIVANTYSQIDSWWDDRCMVCVGNHDTASYSSTYNWTALSMADRSAYYIEPFKSNWSVTHEIGKSYYYKDYTTQGQGIRLIVIDVMLYSSVNTEVEASIAQTTWLQGLLDSATSDELHVIICTHAPNGLSTSLSCGFSQYHVTDRIMPVEPICTLPNTIVDMVRVAIDSGMNFVGYLCGHTHYDDIWVCASDTRQFMYCIGTSNISYKAQWGNTDLWHDVNNDVYNLVTINTTTKTVCLIRGGGANTDRLMRERKTICIDYKNAILVV